MKEKNIQLEDMERKGKTPINSFRLHTPHFDPSKALTMEFPNLHKFPEAVDFIEREE